MQKEAREQIKLLIEKYEKEKNAGRLKDYSEEETKKGFIEPLFEVLGWNFSEKEEVSAEENIVKERVDYGFYIGGKIKFYLEVKRISADLQREDFANQAIRYSFNTGVTWAILSNFETIKVFNAQEIDKALTDKRFFEINYTEYLERFGQLWWLSKESFQKNVLDKEAERVSKKLLKVSITSLLYKDLQKCRDILTKALSEWSQDKKLDQDTLDEGVQKILDRLIFMRVAEDRGVETETLISLFRKWKAGFAEGEKEHFYKWMVKRFRELDGIYNSNLFDKHSFEDWEEYSDKTEEVIKILYGKTGYYEYDFKAMPADVLGAVYESYLGHRLAKSKKGLTVAKDAGKRKEHGIYYTPSFIVDYIVKNALGPVLDNCRSVADLKKIKVLDPACGSGSFLIRAFEMINEKYKKFGAPGNIYTKIPILMENIYGVDLDPQAVEITRLNLLINALEKREKLPLLNHIKNGNSLISGTDEELEKYFGKNFKDKKPFNWQEEFPEVFKRGGFDVIIGNPPYIQSRNLNDEERYFYWDKYLTDTNHSDIYSFFIEKSLNLLKNQGGFGFITPNTWLQTPSFKSLREKIFDESKMVNILCFDEEAKIFSGAQVSNIVFVLQKEKDRKMIENNFIHITKGNIADKTINIVNKIKQKEIKPKQGFNILISQKPQNILDKVFKKSVPLNSVGMIIGGLRTGDDNRFLKTKSDNKDDRKLLRGRNVGRYYLKWEGEYVWYRPELMKVKQAAAPKESKFFEAKEKLLVRMITGGELIATFDDEGFYFLQDNLILPKGNINIRYLLSILNSKLSEFIVKNSVSNIAITQSLLRDFPIYKIDFSKPKEKEKYGNLVRLALKMLKLNKELQKTTENSEKWDSIKSEIEKTDKKIDEEVYKLYGLTKGEIKIIENYQ